MPKYQFVVLLIFQSRKKNATVNNILGELWKKWNDAQIVCCKFDDDIIETPLLFFLLFLCDPVPLMGVIKSKN